MFEVLADEKMVFYSYGAFHRTVVQADVLTDWRSQSIYE